MGEEQGPYMNQTLIESFVLGAVKNSVYDNFKNKYLLGSDMGAWLAEKWWLKTSAPIVII